MHAFKLVQQIKYSNASIKSAHAMSTFFFHILINWRAFYYIVDLERNRIYNHQSLQLRNNGFWIWKGDRRPQPLQNIIIIVLYHEHFLHGTSNFNRSSVVCNCLFKLKHSFLSINQYFVLLKNNGVMEIFRYIH
jgi:hypothetical protein